MDLRPGSREALAMGTRTPALIALVITMAYGIGFVFFDSPPAAYAVVGALVVAAAWVAVGMLNRRRDDSVT
ncbi:hypothetical protein ASG73_00630 [Janibacter sp. Soil728]|uniref:hypothetical protein n=1 Tax=Janibacter sp. Soil728 TaxID=1736393 RepID=UPI0006FA6576|nr:hypothetical protein [Janibacter sp. Soil728]KRE38909.1 hypothetical protein ASG73_00630 [Janibacter sp. Soil728]